MARTTRTALDPKNKARARKRPYVRVTGALSRDYGRGPQGQRYIGEEQEVYLEGRGYGKLLARQMAETYQAAGFRVTGSSAHGFTVEDRYGVRGRIDVVDVVGPFGRVVSA
jgi:hypothetical protein